MTSQEHWPAIVELVDHLVTSGDFPVESRETVLQSLKEREDQRSTGIGNGVAIPHCFSEEIEEVAMVFGKSSHGIEFYALDRAPVYFVVLFVVPKSQYTLHLKTLAAIAKILNSAETRSNLEQAETPTEILEVLSRKTARG
jgi:mannitol/fructose-specific phosphotransferase system IIA component (Ntr-type)